MTPAAKTRLPRKLRPEVRRAYLLVDPMIRASRVLLVVAPAGYGKTTFVRQWAHSTGLPIAWASLDATDDDPVVLATTVPDAVGAAVGHPVRSPPGDHGGRTSFLKAYAPRLPAGTGAA